MLYNQTYHMAELMVEGPDALALLTSLGINSFATFEPGKAKQFVPCTPDGYVIGDVILFGLAENRYNLVGRAPVLNWVTYHAETAGHDVEVAFDQRTALRNDGRRRHYRFQVQGPNAMAVLEKALGHAPEDLKFFNMRTEQIAGVEVTALRHGMAGQPGWELFGPWEEYEAVHEALVSAGEDLGLTLVGGRAYGSNAIESGWIPSPLPAVYTGEGLKAYREWLPASGYEGSASLGGSFVSADIEDYYLTPWDLGYGHLVKFDHDFVGREALEAMADGEHRTKVTLVLNDEDVTRTIGIDVPGHRSGEVHRVAQRGLRDAPVRRRHRRRRDRRGLHLGLLQRQRGQAADPGDPRRRARRAGHRGDPRLGRGGRRHGQAHRRAPRADADASRRRPGPHRRRGPQLLRAGRLARGARLSRHVRLGSRPWRR